MYVSVTVVLHSGEAWSEGRGPTEVGRPSPRAEAQNEGGIQSEKGEERPSLREEIQMKVISSLTREAQSEGGGPE